MFLTESDIILQKAEDYKIEGFQTVIRSREKVDEKVRILALISDKISSSFSIQNDLMGCEIPSIWLKLSIDIGKPVLISGFYHNNMHLMIY